MITLETALVGRLVAAVAGGLHALAVRYCHQRVAGRDRVLAQRKVVRVEDRARAIQARRQIVDKGGAAERRGQ